MVSSRRLNAKKRGVLFPPPKIPSSILTETEATKNAEVITPISTIVALMKSLAYSERIGETREKEETEKNPIRQIVRMGDSLPLGYLDI